MLGFAQPCHGSSRPGLEWCACTDSAHASPLTALTPSPGSCLGWLGGATCSHPSCRPATQPPFQALNPQPLQAPAPASLLWPTPTTHSTSTPAPGLLSPAPGVEGLAPGGWAHAATATVYRQGSILCRRQNLFSQRAGAVRVERARGFPGNQKVLESDKARVSYGQKSEVRSRVRSPPPTHPFPPQPPVATSAQACLARGGQGL